MLCVPTYLAPSSIHGLGVFAAEDIPAGTLTWLYTPGIDVALTFEQARQQPAVISQFLKHYVYVTKTIAGIYILCADNGRFINHSERPSVITDDHREADRAVRLIQKGEEITCNYHTDFGEDPVFNWRPGDPI